jgi:hypothetical protein
MESIFPVAPITQVMFLGIQIPQRMIFRTPMVLVMPWDAPIVLSKLFNILIDPHYKLQLPFRKMDEVGLLSFFFLQF